MTYVLILFAFWGQVSITTQEFNNRAACEYAEKQVHELNTSVQTTCVPKDTVER